MQTKKVMQEYIAGRWPSGLNVFCTEHLFFSYHAEIGHINRKDKTAAVTNRKWSKTTTKHCTQLVNELVAAGYTVVRVWF